jgi:hypothetical protein
MVGVSKPSKELEPKKPARCHHPNARRLTMTLVKSNAPRSQAAVDARKADKTKVLQD